MKNSYKLALAVMVMACFAAIPLSALHADDARARFDKGEADTNDSESSVQRAATVYRALLKEGKVPSTVLTEARCIAVFSDVKTAALGVGGTHGDGVAFCRNADRKWSNPVFLDLNAGSIGIQAGAKSSDIVLYMKAPGSRQAIENGEFSLSGELGVVAGTFDETVVAPKAGIVAYATSAGVFAGASIVGGKISCDVDEQKAFFGRYDPKSIFEGPMPEKVAQSVKELKALLPA